MTKEIENTAGNNFLQKTYHKYFKQLKEIDDPKNEKEKSEKKQAALKAFAIVFGYYLFMDENTREISVNPKQWDNSLVTGISAYNIPFELAGFNQSNKLSKDPKTLKSFGDLIRRIRSKKKKNSLIDYTRYPFEYRYLPAQNLQFSKDYNYRSTETYEILQEHNFSVVLSGEILFWMVLKYGFENEKIKALLEFEANAKKVNNEQLEAYADDLKRHNSSFLTSCKNQEEIITAYKAELTKDLVTDSDTEIADFIDQKARFDIDLSLEIALRRENKYVYDFFVFPIVTKNKATIKHPILLCCFIKNIAELTADKPEEQLIKEDPSTLDGFKVTEMMCEHFSKDFVDEVYYGNVKYAEKKLEAEKSAKAAIMARNMSHNLGSHILFYLKESLKNVDQILSEKVLDNLHDLFQDESMSTENLKKALQGGKVKLPYLVGLGRFLNYLQERQEFIATICGDKIPAFSTMNFKEYIIDEFTYDHKITRHRQTNKQDIKSGEIERNIILSFIAKSEKYNGAIDNPDEPNFNAENRNLCIHFNGQDLIKDIDHEDLRIRNLDVEIPGGIIGRQAFFSIMENIIRNSAKHASKKDKSKLVMNIVLDEQQSDINYQEIQIVQQREISDADFEALEKNLKDKLIDENLKLNQENKGLKEIKISAAYLLGIQNIDKRIIFKGVDRHILEIHKDTDKQLVFSFLMRKPKELVYVTPKAKLVTAEMTKKLTAQKWQVVCFDDFLRLDSNFKLTVASPELKEDELALIEQKSSRFIIQPDFSNQVEARIENLNALFIEQLDLYLRKNVFQSEDTIPKILIDDNNGLLDDGLLVKNTNTEEFLLNNATINGTMVKPRKFKIGYFLSEKDAYQKDNAKFYLPENTQIVTFKQHLKTEASVLEKWEEKEASNGFYACMESITGNNATSRIVRNDIKDSFWFRRVIEAGLLKVLLIDERMHDVYAEKKSEKKRLKNKLLELKNIYVADYNGYDNENEKIPENEGEFRLANDTVIAKLFFEENDLTVNLSNDSNPYHICSIHQGIIDKIASSISTKGNVRNNKDIYENVYRELKRKLPSSIKFIVHSGRSRPPFLPHDIAFLPFASLENLIEDAKISFVNQLIDAKI